MRVDDNGFFLREDILRHFGIRGKRVLDVGAGPLALVAAEVFGCYVTIVESCAETVVNMKQDILRKKLSHNIVVKCANASKLPYASDSFDIAISYGALHHAVPESRTRFIAEMMRVSRDFVVIVELTEAGFTKIHGGGQFDLVPLDWLRSYLDTIGKVVVCSNHMMEVFCVRGVRRQISPW